MLNCCVTNNNSDNSELDLSISEEIVPKNQVSQYELRALSRDVLFLQSPRLNQMAPSDDGSVQPPARLSDSESCEPEIEKSIEDEKPEIKEEIEEAKEEIEESYEEPEFEEEIEEAYEGIKDEEAEAEAEAEEGIEIEEVVEEEEAEKEVKESEPEEVFEIEEEVEEAEEMEHLVLNVPDSTSLEVGK